MYIFVSEIFIMNFTIKHWLSYVGPEPYKVEMPFLSSAYSEVGINYGSNIEYVGCLFCTS